MNESDEILYSRFLNEGNEEDLRQLLGRYRESLTLFLCGLVHDMDDAEELMLDTFAVAASGTARFSGRSSFRTWLFAIGRKLAASRLRKRRGRAEPLSDFADEVSAGPEFSLMRAERDRRLYAAMQHLNDDYRQVLFLLYFEDMDHGEAARVMGRSVKQIYNLAFRGKQALREALERMGFEYAEYR